LARNDNNEDFIGPIRRLLVGLIVFLLLGTFLIWRIDSPRVERFRIAVIDKVVPSFSWAMAPVTGVVNLVGNFQSYQQLADQNDDLRDLNKVRLDPKLTYVTGVVMTDSGSPFRQSLLVNVGERDGIIDGWPAMDGIVQPHPCHDPTIRTESNFGRRQYPEPASGVPRERRPDPPR